jgi:hypothetical protein
MKIIFDHQHGHVYKDRVFCEAFAIPEGEKEYELLELGFLPNVQPPIYWYQAKSCRINNDNIKLSYKRRKILSQLSFEIFRYSDKKKEVDSFFENYFKEKDFDIIDSYNKNSNFGDLQVMEVTFENEVVGYTRFREFEKAILGLETSFTSNNPRFSLGKSFILILSNYGKTKGINYLYIYESYDDYFPYKLEITGAEYWEGEKWISV